MSFIQDGEILYRYAKPDVFPDGQTELPISIFNDADLSCDWEKIQQTPALSPHVANGRRMVVSITVCDAIRNPVNPRQTTQVVAAWKQDILHDPLAAQVGNAFTPNPSHALIRGKKKGAVTSAIRDNSTYVIVTYIPTTPIPSTALVPPAPPLATQ